MPSKSSSIRAAAGQLLTIGFDGVEISPQLISLIRRIQPGGVILFARNIVNGPQTHRLLKDCQAETEQRLFTCVDLEGGLVDRFRRVTGPAPSAADVFLTGDSRLYRKHGAIIGRVCSALGFNVDFAPVLDLAFEASRPVMSTRTFSTEPRQVTAYARAFLAGLNSAGVIGAGKHFPGLGEGALDSHHELPVITKTFQKLWVEDLAPYRAMSRELAMVLVSHANYPEVTGDRLPASLSAKWMTDVLRGRIGYRGLIVSDDLEMGGVLKAAPLAEAAVAFVRAGGDLCLVCREQKNVEQAFEGLVREAERDPRFRRRVLQSARRISASKRRLKRPGARPSEEKIRRLSTELWEFSERVRYSSLPAIAAAGAKA